MALVALAFPILPGKAAGWRRMIDEINGARHAEFAATREQFGVRERTFLQSTPEGDLVIVTLEGDDPAAFLAQEGAQTDSFTRWFAPQFLEFHGLDMAHAEPGPLPELVLDSRPG